MQAANLQKRLQPGSELAERLRLRHGAPSPRAQPRGVPLCRLQRLNLLETQPLGKLLINAGSGGVEGRMRTVNRHAGTNQIEQYPSRRVIGSKTLEWFERQW